MHNCSRAAIAALVWIACTGHAAAVDNVAVVGLFASRAVLVIDGRQRLLRTGQTSPEGVKLISADSESAVLEIDGETREYRLGNAISATFAPPSDPKPVQVLPDAGNLYTISGSINGFAMSFVVDTGASAVALSGRDAKRIGIDYQGKGSPGVADTPAGQVATHHVMLDRVRVGEIELRNVDALVIDGEHPRQVLLGMTFLGRLELRQSGRVLELRQRY